MPSDHPNKLSEDRTEELSPEDDGPSRDGAKRSDQLKIASLAAIYILIISIQWLARSAIELARHLEAENEKRRSNSSERWTRNVIAAILSEPEFSHSARISGSITFVLAHLKDNEEWIVRRFIKLRKGLKDRTQLAAVIVAAVAYLLLLIVNGIPNKWRDNDSKRLSEFPSTKWMHETLAPLGREGSVALGIVLSGLMAAAVYGIWIEVRKHYRDYVQLKLKAKEEMLPYVRVAFNEMSEEQSPTDLRFDRAPALSSTTDRLYVIDRVEVDRIATLIHELGASAVAISGPRGAGKSTLLHSIATSHRLSSSLCISLAAPASYEPKEFVITLYRQLCEYVIRRVSVMTASRPKRAARVILTTLRAIIILSAALVALTQWRPARAVIESYGGARLIPLNIWQAGSYLALLAVLYVLLGALRPYKRVPGAGGIVDRAVRDEERLRFLQNVAIERSGGIKAKVGLELGRKRTRQLMEQPASLPDLVHSYRSFVDYSLSWWRQFWPSGHLVVIIDELDRVTEVEAAERFINDIKGIFGIPHCTYLVTVSEDALSQFERRMVGIRPVLDSTFDEVVRLSVLDFDQAKEMLARRLVGFPQAFIALCHSLSGGIPRELIRTARALIDIRRTNKQNDLLFLLYEIVLQEVRRLKSGLIGRVNNELTGLEAFGLLKMLADPEWPERDAFSVLRAASDLVEEGETGRGGRISMELGVALFYYGTILQVFTQFWHEEVKDVEGLAESAQALAVARSVMPASVELALVHIQRLREEERLTIG
ncbi:P-loop NTPase fold protein [Micromonospora sp. WMMD712]|uniref:P-loop NTPase fold protein n=1 Tax=Micromonospora sp. WMMD712 TaxID=3016096 RepID=UPI00249C7527|nr:P-loop NTPase fold protein [Micromonospora sp. WMMD712]WFE58889.1 hypothetical protein O7633_19465 [Micromonospora sp. WMMD712]